MAEARLSMTSLQKEIDDFQKENKADIKHFFKVGGESGYYTLAMHDKTGKTQIAFISTSPQNTKRKGVRAGTLKACRFAWLISRWK